jgi:hypothetical protein
LPKMGEEPNEKHHCVCKMKLVKFLVNVKVAIYMN